MACRAAASGRPRHSCIDSSRQQRAHRGVAATAPATTRCLCQQQQAYLVRGRTGAHSGAAVVGFVYQPGPAQAWGTDAELAPQQQQQQQLAAFSELPDVQQQLLCDVLSVSPAQAQLLLLACPAASHMGPGELKERWAALQALLPLPAPQLLQALLQLPQLLPQPQATVHARLAAAARTLGLPLAALKSPAAAKTPGLHWRLVITPQQRLLQQLAQLSQLLGGGVRQQQLVAMMCAEPQLVAAEQAVLLSTAEALEQVCGCRVTRLVPHLLAHPRLLVHSADAVYAAAARLQQLLVLSEEGLALVLKRCPAALLAPPERFTLLLQQLARDLAVAPDVAADILLQEPQLLLQRPAAVSLVLTTLRSTFRLGAGELMQVVQFDPSILLIAPGHLAQATRQFKLLAHTCKPWAAEYRHLMSWPANVARALRIEPLRLQRLVFLSRQGFAHTISLRTALTLSGRRFVGAYPQYKGWLAQNYSAGPAPKRYTQQQQAGRSRRRAGGAGAGADAGPGSSSSSSSSSGYDEGGIDADEDEDEDVQDY